VFKVNADAHGKKSPQDFTDFHRLKSCVNQRHQWYASKENFVSIRVVVNTGSIHTDEFGMRFCEVTGHIAQMKRRLIMRLGRLIQRAHLRTLLARKLFHIPTKRSTIKEIE
jgi:hypothetical protein